MSSTKYITYIYKIFTDEDKLRLFIGSTKENLKNLLMFFIKNLQTKKKNILYNWINSLNTSKLKIKLIKSYPVSNIDEQRKREKYWIDKYKNYGYDVLYKPFKNKEKEKEKENSKIYICLENVTMESIIEKYGNKIIYISKNGFNFLSNESNTSNIPPPPLPITFSKKNIVKKTPNTSKPLPITEGNGYLNELKNLLTLRKSSNLSLADLAKQNKPKIPIKTDHIKIKKTIFKPPPPIINPGQELLKELKRTIKKVE